MQYGSPVGQIFTRRLLIRTKPTLIADTDARTKKGRTTLIIYVPHSPDVSAVYLGGADVEASTGIPIPIETRFILPVHNHTQIYLVADVPVEAIVAECTP